MPLRSEIRKGGFVEQPGSITPRGTFRCAGDKQETRAERDLEEKWSTPPPSRLKTRRASCASSFSHSLASPPKHIYHSIACIGAFVAPREGSLGSGYALGAPHIGERSESGSIASFCDRIAELKPQLVTFNGNSFDLPVLRYRAMINEVSAPGLSARPYFNRYTEMHSSYATFFPLSPRTPKGVAERAQQDHGNARKAGRHRRRKSSDISSKARSRRSPTTARRTSSTPIGYGCGMSFSRGRFDCGRLYREASLAICKEIGLGLR